MSGSQSCALTVCVNCRNCSVSAAAQRAALLHAASTGAVFGLPTAALFSTTHFDHAQPCLLPPCPTPPMPRYKCGVGGGQARGRGGGARRGGAGGGCAAALAAGRREREPGGGCQQRGVRGGCTARGAGRAAPRARGGRAAAGRGRRAARRAGGPARPWGGLHNSLAGGLVKKFFHACPSRVCLQLS